MTKGEARILQHGVITGSCALGREKGRQPAVSLLPEDGWIAAGDMAKLTQDGSADTPPDWVGVHARGKGCVQCLTATEAVKMSDRYPADWAAV